MTNSRAGRSGATIITKIADETVNNSNTLQDDDELKFEANINKTYIIRLTCWMTLAAASDFSSALTVPSGATGVRVNDAWTSNVDMGTSVITAQGLTVTTGTRVYKMEFRVVMSTTSGTIQFQWSQNTAVAENTVMLKGSYMEIFST